MNLEKAEVKRDQLKQTLEKFRNSSKSLNNILESQVIDKFKTRLGYDAATAASLKVESFVNLTDKSGSDKGYHLVPPPLTGNIIHCKPDLTFMDEIVKSENLDVTTVVTPCNDKIVENKGVSNSVESNAKSDGIFISQDKYVAEILKKFDFASVKTASTPMETNKALIKDEEAEDVDVHLYRSMIGSLMYLTASRPDIMFAVCACARFQVTPKTSHFNDVKRIFRYLKGQPKLGLWYPRDSPFDLEAFSDSDYAGASLDRKSTTGGCQFLGKRLISWQCKKQTIVANSTTEAEYVAAANCYGQVLWIQNQMLDYRFNFMNTKIYIDNESTICIVKNLMFHSKTKHIEIRHHFIRDSYEKKLIQVIKIHTDQNVADLLTKAFDTSRFNFIIASIRLLNL
ncbi:hypothetical protein Tco_1070743 [Tanacetum coccineum]|uniref:Uncharacterized protein n=1 Tax=Tanacetum coccineum TaxID=301880 RepID=A0ABQ5HMG0_9ASTR